MSESNSRTTAVSATLPLTLAFSLVAAIGVASTTLSAQVTPGDMSGASAGAIAASPVGASFLENNPGTGFIEENGAIARIYGPAFSHGANPVDSADSFLRANAAVLSSDFNHLMAVGPNSEGTHVVPMGYDAATETYRFSLVGYSQHVNGVPVFRGDVRCLVRNEPGSPLVLVANALKNLGDFPATFTGKPISPSKINVSKASRSPLNQFGPGATISNQEQVIWAGYEEAIATTPRLAIKFIVTGTGVFDRELHQRMLYVVDAATGKILFQEDQISNADINVTVNGVATTGTAADACNPEASQPLPYAHVAVGATNYYANAAGNVIIPNAAGTNLSVVSTMLTAGKYFNVNDVVGAESALAYSSTGGLLSFTHNSANTDESDRAEVNAYIQANMVRDYLLAYNPSFPTLGTQLSWPINVQVSGTCNAFYDGSSINFYPAGGGCNNTAFSVVVHHEYGHHIVATAGSGQGAYGEGFGDVMGVIVTDESRLAVGFQSCATGIRDANNTVQYSSTGCSSAGSEIHACGTLLSGCVWSLRNNLAALYPTTYRSILSNLCCDSVLLHSGTSITNSITIDFLTLDDNDGNIANGTPNYASINSAFSAHGLAGPALQLIGFEFPAGRPALASPAGGTQFPVNVVGIASIPQSGSGKLFYRIGTSGTFTQVSMAEGVAHNYTASLPASACGSTVQYYFSASTPGGALAYSPTTAPTALYTAMSATGTSNSFTDTVETVLGWTTTTAGDTATTGAWVRGDPVGTLAGTVEVQPELDYSNPGVNCYFTGQGAVGATVGSADVDGGFTTLTSPAMNGLDSGSTVSYARWYSNTGGGSPNADTFRVQISGNNGTTWVALETVGPTGAETSGGWVAKSFRVSDFVTPSTQVKIRFIADDAGTGSVIEAAVDEIRMSSVTCAVPADLNADGYVNGADLTILLNAWGTSGLGDIDGDGVVNGADLTLLLNAWNG